MSEFEYIRKQARLSFPRDDEYLFRLGVALYSFASINSFMTEIICHIDSDKNRTELLTLTSGDVLDVFKQTRKKIKAEKRFQPIHNLMQKIADMFEVLNTERTDFVHAYPITNKKNEQILHRRKDEKKKYFEVDKVFLDDFISHLDIVSDKLYEIRKIVRPDL
jgi:hypothetical protein